MNPPHHYVSKGKNLDLLSAVSGQYLKSKDHQTGVQWQHESNTRMGTSTEAMKSNHEGSSHFSSDAAVWCEECGIHNIGECFIHGGTMTIAEDNELPSRAVLSMPKILQLKRIGKVDPTSIDVSAKRGVFAKKTVAPRTMFGPLEAVVSPKKPRIPTRSMEYQIVDPEGVMQFLDTSNDNSCNWMIFVRPADNFEQQNLAAFQKESNVYFVSTRTIASGQELRVWYAAAYAKAIRKRILLPEVNVKNNSREFHRGLKKVKQEKTPLPVVPTDKQLLSTNLRRSTVHTRPRDCSMSNCTGCNQPSPKRRKVRQKKVTKSLGDADAVPEVPTQTMATSIQKEQPVSGNIPNEEIMNPDPDPLPSEDTSQMNLTSVVSSTVAGTARDRKDYQNTNPTITAQTPLRTESVMQNNPDVKPVELSSKKEGSKRRTVYRCKYCEKTFTNNESYLIHESHHTNTLPYKCTWEGCDKAFLSKFKYQRHCNIHTQANHFKCKYCSNTFNRLDHLKKHLIIHDSNRDTYVCELCGATYLYKSTLDYHMAKHEAENTSALTCLVCKERFESNQLLKQHLQRHNRYKPEKDKERKHPCPHCDRVFTVKKDVRRHMVTHTKERQFLCECCAQSFVRKDHLRRHYLSSHKTEFYQIQRKTTPFGCDACLKVFKKKEFLDYHIKTSHPNGIVVPEVKEKVRQTTSKNNKKMEASVVNQKSRTLLIVEKESVRNKVKSVQTDKSGLEKFDQGKVSLLQQQMLSKKGDHKLQVTNQPPATEVKDVYPVKLFKVGDLPIEFEQKSTFAEMKTSSAQSNLMDTEEYSKAEIYTLKTAPVQLKNQTVSAVNVNTKSTVGSDANQKGSQTFINTDQNVRAVQKGQPQSVTIQLPVQKLEHNHQHQHQVAFHQQEQQQQLLQNQLSQQISLLPQQPSLTPVSQPQQQHQQMLLQPGTQPVPIQPGNQPVPIQQPQPTISLQQLPLLPGLQIPDLLNSAINLNPQEITQPVNANIVNLISVSGTNFVLGGQGIANPLQWTILKDPQSQTMDQKPALGSSHHSAAPSLQQNTQQNTLPQGVERTYPMTSQNQSSLVASQASSTLDVDKGHIGLQATGTADISAEEALSIVTNWRTCTSDNNITFLPQPNTISSQSSVQPTSQVVNSTNPFPVHTHQQQPQAQQHQQQQHQQQQRQHIFQHSLNTSDSLPRTDSSSCLPSFTTLHWPETMSELTGAVPELGDNSLGGDNSVSSSWIVSAPVLETQLQQTSGQRMAGPSSDAK